VERTVDREYCAGRGIDVVRRPTGGRAVLHHQEITYSVVSDTGRFPGGSSITESYRVISEGLCRGLNLAGIAAEVSRPALPGRAEGGGADEGPRSANPCFSSISRYELTFRGRKLLGSSQRRMGERFLQHGSLPVVPHWDLLLGATGQEGAGVEGERMYTSLGEAAGIGEDGIADLVPQLARGMAERLAVELLPQPLSEEEIEGVARLERERFGTDRWNLGR
jgi:lipoate-protein ligase A